MKVIGLSGKAGHGKDFIAMIIRGLAQNEFGTRACVWSLAHTLKARAYGEARGEFSFEDVWFNKPPAIRKLLQELGTEKGRMVFGDDFWLLQAEAFIRLFGDAAGIGLVIVPDIRFPNEVDFAQFGGRAPSTLRAQKMRDAATIVGLTAENEQELLDTDPARLLELEADTMSTYLDIMRAEARETNGLCFRIQSDRPTLTGAAAEHPSETSLDNAPPGTFNGILYNNVATTAKDLETQLMGHLDSILGYRTWGK
jgi:hypothetical protein